VVELDSATPTAVERATGETRIEKRAVVVTEDGGLIVTIVMGAAGVGIVMEVTDMADAVARIEAIVVMMGMIVLSAGVAIVIVIVANDRAEIDMEEGAIATVVVIVRVVIASAKIAAIGIDRRIAGAEVPRPVAAEGETASAAIIPDLSSAVGISCLPKPEDQTDRIRMREGRKQKGEVRQGVQRRLCH
jgi:hypothetical protein